MAKAEKKDKRSDRPATQVIDGATGKPEDTPPQRRIDLSSLRDVRIEMAAVYRKMDARQITSQEGTRLVYVLRQIADVITVADLEKRIDELEARGAGAGTAVNYLPERTLLQ